MTTVASRRVYDVVMRTRFQADCSRPRAPRVVLPVMLAAAFVCVAGCQKTALRPDDRRSQFDRYDQSRSQRAQPFLEDEFGRRTPNLKARLLVSDE